VIHELDRNAAQSMSEFVEEPTPQQARRLSPRRQWLLVGLAVVAVVVAFGVVPRLAPLLFPPPPEAPAPVDDGTFTPTQKQWQTLSFETLHAGTWTDSVTTDGMITTDDDQTTPVVSPFTGAVTRIYAALGDRVAKGAPLFAVAASEAAQSEADLLTAGAQLKQAQAEVARTTDLAAHGGAAQKDLDQAHTDLATAQGALAAAEARRKALGGSVSGGLGVVRAPVAGIVTQRSIGPGQNVSGTASGSGTPAFAISNFGQVWVTGYLREEDAGKAHVGEEAVVTLLTDPAHPIHARISYVAPQLDPATRRLAVRATLDNRNGRLKPQMFAHVQVLTGQSGAGLTVSEDAVIFESDTARVWVANPRNHKLAIRQIIAGPVTDGPNDTHRVRVISGLSDGDTVVTAGSLFIDRGAKTD